MTGKSKMRVMALFLSLLLLLNGMGGIQVEAKTAVSPKKLVLTSKNKTLYVGQKSSIKVKKVTPSKASKKVTYQSSNKKVVTVNTKGVLRAKKAGKATVTVISKLNAKVKTKCKINVKKAPTKITLKQTSKTLKAGESFQVGVKSIKPKNAYNKFKYKSSNTEIATVDSKGLVIAKKAGTAVITVASPAGKKVSAKCNIVVEGDSNATQPTGPVQPEGPTGPV